MHEDLPAPQDPLAERLVIGAIFNSRDADTFHQVAEILTADSFTVLKYRLFFEAMQELFNTGSPITLAAVFHSLYRQGKKDLIGSVADWTGMPDLANLAGFCESVAETERLRKLQAAALDIQSRVALAHSSREIIQYADALFAASQSAKKKSSSRPSEIISLSGGMDAFATGNIGAGAAIMTPWPRINQATKGLRPKKFWTLGGIPGTGKTSMATQIADAAVAQNFRVRIVSREMGAEELLHNMACTRARINNQELLAGGCSYEERLRFQEAVEYYTTVADDLLQIDDAECTTVPGISSKMRRSAAEGENIDLLIVDFIQLLKGVGKSESRRHEVDEIAYGLKGIANDFGSRVLGLAQLNTRKTESESHGAPKPNVMPNGTKPPSMGDFRESGAIEQACDTALILRLTDVEQQFRATSLIDAYLLKQRGGKKGKIPFKFHTWLREFEEIPSVSAQGFEAA